MRNTIVKELKEMGANFTKARFYKESPFRKARGYKDIGWEIWLYGDDGGLGYLIAEETFNNKGCLRVAIDTFNN